VIGSFVSASLLDVVGGEDAGPASERLIAIGIAAYGPTALTGVSDWADSEAVNDRVRRTGLVHAATNAVALTLYTGSLAARRRGSHREGVLLGAAGATALVAGGYLGAHLSYSAGVGVDQTAFDPGPLTWTSAGADSPLAERRPTRAVAGDTPVLVFRDGDALYGIHDRCTHRGCSLADGEVDGHSIICSCHGSRFDLHTGAVERGPATAPQPAFEVRDRNGVREVRRRPTGTAAPS
jgi:nitrite reductase/ring-hydroxylating ferredoxin subunit